MGVEILVIFQMSFINTCDVNEVFGEKFVEFMDLSLNAVGIPVDNFEIGFSV